MKKFLTYVVMLFLTLGVQAATFLVNSFPDDFPDLNPGDGYCHITVFDPVAVSYTHLTLPTIYSV